MQIKNAQYVISSARLEQCPKSSLPEYAFIGRSNVGKSSLINMLCGQNHLAKTSSMPGKTILINHFLINGEWHLVDLPGYGFAKRSKQAQAEFERMISSYILGREQLTNLFVLIDIRHKPQKIDLEFIDWLGEHGIPFSIVFTKADKLSKGVAASNVRAYMKSLEEAWEELPPHFITSAEDRTGRDELLDYIDGINKSLQD